MEAPWVTSPVTINKVCAQALESAAQQEGTEIELGRSSSLLYGLHVNPS